MPPNLEIAQQRVTGWRIRADPLRLEHGRSVELHGAFGAVERLPSGGADCRRPNQAEKCPAGSRGGLRAGLPALCATGIDKTRRDSQLIPPAHAVNPPGEEGLFGDERAPAQAGRCLHGGARGPAARRLTPLGGEPAPAPPMNSPTRRLYQPPPNRPKLDRNNLLRAKNPSKRPENRGKYPLSGNDLTGVPKSRPEPSQTASLHDFNFRGAAAPRGGATLQFSAMPPLGNSLASGNKCLARSNKSQDAGKATKSQRQCDFRGAKWSKRHPPLRSCLREDRHTCEHRSGQKSSADMLANYTYALSWLRISFCDSPLHEC
jgi:hypothetical protein